MERIRKDCDKRCSAAKGSAQQKSPHPAQGELASRIGSSFMMMSQRKKLQSLFGDAAQLRENIKPNRTGLPDNLKSGIESLSGISLNHVKVHYNSSQPAQLNALAYAQGCDIHIAPGQEKYLPHEAWHVVQQAQGRGQPTRRMKNGVAVNDDKGLEREADVMGERALQKKQREINSRSTPRSAECSTTGLRHVQSKEEPVQCMRLEYRGNGIFANTEIEEGERAEYDFRNPEDKKIIDAWQARERVKEGVDIELVEKSYPDVRIFDPLTVSGNLKRLHGESLFETNVVKAVLVLNKVLGRLNIQFSEVETIVDVANLGSGTFGKTSFKIMGKSLSEMTDEEFDGLDYTQKMHLEITLNSAKLNGSGFEASLNTLVHETALHAFNRARFIKRARTDKEVNPGKWYLDTFTGDGVYAEDNEHRGLVDGSNKTYNAIQNEMLREIERDDNVSLYKLDMLDDRVGEAVKTNKKHNELWERILEARIQPPDIKRKQKELILQNFWEPYFDDVRAIISGFSQDEDINLVCLEGISTRMKSNIDVL